MTDDIGKKLLAWWREALRPADDTSAARALRARLKRADALEVLAQPQVHDLVAAAPWLRHQPKGLIRVVQGLAHVERNDSSSLARVLGGDPPAMSRARFERLIRSEADELPRALRRAISLTEGGCNVALLGRDMLNWDHPEAGEKIRRDWYFDYFNAARTNAATEGKTEDIPQ